MASSKDHNTPARRFCKQHLRRLFWDEKLWQRYFMGELDLWGKKPSRRDMIDHKGKHIAWSQEVYFTDPANEDRQVCRAQWYLSDDLSLCGSGAPDPKEINWKGINTHIHYDGGVCELCEAGDTLPPAMND